MRNVVVLIQLALLIYCLIDCIQSDSVTVRNLPKLVWVLLIVFVPVVGCVAWLVAGRPLASAARPVAWPSTRTAGFPEYERPRGPDDDPTFLAGIDRPDTTHDQLLSQWEADLRDREERLRKAGHEPEDGPPSDDVGSADGSGRS